MPFNFKKAQTVEFPWENRQCLGRLFRVGQNPVVVVPPPSIEAEICRRIENKLILIGKTTEGTGESLHLDIPKNSDIKIP